MDFKYIKLSTQQHVATLLLSRPELHNAFDDVMIEELIKALEHLQTNNKVRVVLLRAAGKSFSAGADLHWMQRMVNYDYEQNLQDANKLALLMHTLNQLHKPTIAVIEGAAFGGGVGLVACCDVAIATDNAKFCLSETRIGLIPAVISPYIINAIGERQARRYYLTAETFDAQQAQQLGLIHMVCAPEQLDKHLEVLTTALLQNSPAAIVAAKQLIHATSRGPLDKPMREDTAHRIAAIRTSAEGQEGLRAFLEKRPPQWSE
jgi:methylglutaconyl-CoA hydratase